MRLGGCGAVTACDLCIYLAKHRNLSALYPFDPHTVTIEQYLAFGTQMRAYLSPRPTGIDKTEIFVDGFNDYLNSCGVHPIRLQNFSGDEDTELAVRWIRDQINRGFPVPYLMLMHRDKRLKDFMWHWFLLNGYDESADTFRVKAVSYGEAVWLDLRRLWQTGRKQKGGVVLIYPEPENDAAE